jgi:asparagine synthase (glutamine-hydrolysing)
MRENFTVAISGDGGDEIFGGYYRNFNGYNTWNKIRKLNKIQKKIYILLLNILNWSVPIEKIEYYLKKNNLEIFPTDLKLKINKLRSLFDQKNLSEYYSKLVSSDFSKKEFQNGKVMNNLLEKVTQSEMSDYDKIMLLDINFYLTNDILTKVDRSSMAASLEVRSPFLNHKIYEKSLTLPNELKFKNNTPKYILKKILNKYVPQHLFNRPKQGFEIPIEEWLLGSKKNYYRDIIFDKSTNLFEIIPYEKIFDKWKIFENRTVNYSKLFWNILMYQMWFKNNF